MDGLRVLDRVLRRGVLEVATSSTLSPLHDSLTQGAATIFLLHRFSDPRRGIVGKDPELLRSFLDWLRQRRMPLVSLEEMVDRIVRGQPLEGAVCFTVDDGYADFYTVGMDLFAEFDCPVTVFLPTDFLDGAGWMWWDVLYCLIEATTVPSLTVPPTGERPGARPTCPLGTDREKVKAWRDLMARMRHLDPDTRDELISLIARDLDVEPPEPGGDPRFEPLTWDQVRACVARGASFGPHTRSHPWMASATDRDVEAEILDSWRRLEEELSDPLPVLGYPYGTRQSFRRRDGLVARECGMRAAVSAIPEMVTHPGGDDREHLYRLPRIGFPGDVLAARKIVTGLLRLQG